MEFIKVHSQKDLEEILFGKAMNRWSSPIVLVLRGTYWRDKEKKGYTEVFTNNYTITTTVEIMMPEMAFHLKSEFEKREINEPSKVEQEVKKILDEKYEKLIKLAKDAMVPVVYSIKDARTEF